MMPDVFLALRGFLEMENERRSRGEDAAPDMFLYARALGYVKTAISDQPAPDNPHGSCLICGHDRPFAVWCANIGVCEQCRNAAQTALLSPSPSLSIEEIRTLLTGYRDWLVKCMPEMTPASIVAAQEIRRQTDAVLARLQQKHTQTTPTGAPPEKGHGGDTQS